MVIGPTARRLGARCGVFRLNVKKTDVASDNKQEVNHASRLRRGGDDLGGPVAQGIDVLVALNALAVVGLCEFAMYDSVNFLYGSLAVLKTWRSKKSYSYE